VSAHNEPSCCLCNAPNSNSISLGDEQACIHNFLAMSDMPNVAVCDTNDLLAAGGKAFARAQLSASGLVQPHSAITLVCPGAGKQAAALCLKGGRW
jgi:hypothetical protein